MSLIGVKETSCNYLSGTAFSLLESTANAFNFPISIHTLPEKEIQNAHEIMKQITKAFAPKVCIFITEVEKVVSAIENVTKTNSITLSFLTKS